MLIGGIEAGGTKFVCAVGDESGKIINKTTFATEDPNNTLDKAKEFFENYKIEALGVGSFGPVDLSEGSNTYGYILNTPKDEWKQFNLLGRLEQDYQTPIIIDTDVNVAALGEYQYGSYKNINSLLYITVGTGIGAGFVKNGKTYMGENHPEMGHIRVHQREEDKFLGTCPFHGTCLEGLASGPAIEKRHGKKGIHLANDYSVWELEAYYLAQAITTYLLILSPHKIVIGGGVMKQKQLHPLIHQNVIELLNGYIKLDEIEKLIVAPTLNDEQGIRGALALTLQHQFIRGGITSSTY